METNFRYEISSDTIIPDVPISIATGYDSWITIYTRNNKAGYEFGCVAGKERQLSVILNYLSTDKMFQELCQNIPEQMEKGSEVVENAFLLQDELARSEVEEAIIQPISFSIEE